MTSSMRNFGASRDKRRPDVRFCGVEAAGEEGLGLTRGWQRSGQHAGLTTSAWHLHFDLIGAVGGIGYRMACRVPLNRRHGHADWNPGIAMVGAAQLDGLQRASANIGYWSEPKLPHSCRI
jgi:hypothetical protein